MQLYSPIAYSKIKKKILSSIFNHSSASLFRIISPSPLLVWTRRSEESREIIMVDRGGERMIQAYREKRHE